MAAGVWFVVSVREENRQARYLLGMMRKSHLQTCPHSLGKMVHFLQSVVSSIDLVVWYALEVLSEAFSLLELQVFSLFQG